MEAVDCIETRALWSSRKTRLRALNSMIGLRTRNSEKPLVPKKGLEPPHPCEYVDLNHARLPIPPLRHGTCSVDFN
jgi:hypothetical protein